MRKFALLSGMALSWALAGSEALALGKAGLWNMTLNLNIGGMPQVPPEALAQMRALGMSIPGLGAPIQTQVRMTPEQAAGDATPPMQNGCRNQNVQRNGNTIIGEIVCMGELNGTGTFEATQVSEIQIRNRFSFNGTRRGQPAQFTAEMEGNWASADCGNVAPY
jgi:hypothetical protein